MTLDETIRTIAGVLLCGLLMVGGVAACVVVCRMAKDNP